MAGRVMLGGVLAVAMVATGTLTVRASGAHAKEVRASGAHAKEVRASAGPPAQDKKPPQVVFDIPPISDRIQIDGSKNPEMIPQWDAWQAAFEIIARISNLPTDLVKQLSKDEVEWLRAAAKENAQDQLACQKRVLELAPTLKTEEARFINERTQEINLECRWQTLRLRDRLLASLPPLGQAAVSQFVESKKAGIRVYVPRNELAFYRRPQ